MLVFKSEHRGAQVKPHSVSSMADEFILFFFSSGIKKKINNIHCTCLTQLFKGLGKVKRRNTLLVTLGEKSQ